MLEGMRGVEQSSPPYLPCLSMAFRCICQRHRLPRRVLVHPQRRLNLEHARGFKKAITLVPMLLPFCLWPKTGGYLVVSKSVERKCARDGCPNTFVPKKGNQKYCGPKCAKEVALGQIAAAVKYRQVCPHCGKPIGTKSGLKRKRGVTSYLKTKSFW